MNAQIHGRRDRKRQATTELLTRTGFSLFEQHGFEAVSMEQIASAADVAKGTLYNYFPSKEALLTSYFHQSLAESWAELCVQLAAQPDAVVRFRLFLEAAADWAQAHRIYLLPYLRHRFQDATSGHMQSSHSGIEIIFRQLLQGAQQQGAIHAAQDVAQLTTYLQFLYMGAMMRWLAMPAGDLRAEFGAMLQLFLHGAQQAPLPMTAKDTP